MNAILSVFDYHPQDTLLAGLYDPCYVALSILIAIFASYMALQVAGQVQRLRNTSRRQISLLVGSVALGGGVWSMHFIAMLAFDLCTPVNYGFGLTLTSMFPSVLASWVALQLLSKDSIDGWSLAVGGVLVGAGIGVMHYTGMAAMEMAPLLRYDPWFFALSIVVAVTLAMLALWVRFSLDSVSLSPFKLNLISATVMGCAISGMHYTGMAAARFVVPEGVDVPMVEGLRSGWLAGAVTISTLVITGLVAAINLVLKYREISQRAYANEKRLLAMRDTAPDGILTLDIKGRIRTANQTAEKILGWSQQALLQKNIGEVLPDIFGEDATGYFKVYLHSGYSDLVGQPKEAVACGSDGKQIPVRIGMGHTRLPGEDIFVLFIGDISERLAMEASIKENEAKFRSLIGNIPGVAFRCALHNGSWQKLFISDAIERVAGYPAEDFLLPSPKRDFASLVHPDDLDSFLENQGNASHLSQEFRILHRDGGIRWVLETSSLVTDEEGQPLYLDGFMMDISQRREMEQALRAAKEEAELAVEAKSAFLANMSHEIRTPMNAIIGFSDLMMTSALPPQEQKHLKTINTAANNLLHLLNDILDSAKLEKGKLELVQQDFSLTNMVDAVMSTLSLQARKKQIGFELKMAPEVQDFYYGAEDRLRQVLTNIVGNAIKFTEQGSVTVTVSAKGDNLLTFCVQDTGIGISADALAHIFEPFTQADASMSRRFGGTGLGTTISRQLVELMGGRIWADSEEGKGSCFCFEVPLKPGKAVNVEQRHKEMLTLPPMKVLVADDIEQNRDLLEQVLKRQQHQVTLAADGAEALEAFNNDKFDLILLDIQMPNMDGLEAARAIRKLEISKGLDLTPIIALTASAQQEDRQASLNAGMSGFATKPVNMKQLMVEIARVLGMQLQLSHAPEETSESAEVMLDLRHGEEIWGSVPAYIEQLRYFLRKQAGAVTDMRQAIVQQDYASVSTMAHSLRGLSGNLGILTMEPILAQLELSATQQSNYCAELLDSLQLAFTALENELKDMNFEAADVFDIENESAPQPENCLTAVIKLLKATGSNEFDEVALKELKANINQEYKAAVEAIEEAMDDFDFAQAHKLLTDLQLQLAR